MGTKQPWEIYAMEYYLAMWMELENIILGGISQSERQILYDFTPISIYRTFLNGKGNHPV